MAVRIASGVGIHVGPSQKECQVCKKFFIERGLHSHISRTHDMTLGEYYGKYYPRFDRLTKEPIQFEEVDEYFAKDFNTHDNMIAWLKAAPKEEAKKYLIDCLVKRVEAKELKFAPSFNEVQTTRELPPYRAYRHFFGSYKAACEVAGVEVLFDDTIVPSKRTVAPDTILIDTREQQPLPFKNSRQQKLAFGDYTLADEAYTYTYVDRKSEGDFKSTVTVGHDRFVREVERAVQMDSYIYVVVESSIKDIEKNNLTSAHKANLNYVWASMRRLQHHFPKNLQFVFTGSREKSMKLIPYLLAYGKELWPADIQSLLSQKGK